jgi:hypothetical protein
MRPLLVVTTLFGAAACSDGAAEPEAPGTMPNAQGGTTPSPPAQPQATAGTGGTTAGGSAGSIASGAADAGGGTSSGGATGGGGIGGSFTPNPADPVPEDVLPAAAAARLIFWEMPCLSDGHRSDSCVATTPGVNDTGGADGDGHVLLSSERQFAGAAGKTYQVKFRVRGVIEPHPYSGGERVGEYFQIGGTTPHPKFSIIKVEVESPAQTYYLNAHPEADHFAYPADYEATLPIAGGSKVTLSWDSLNREIMRNMDDLTPPTVFSVPGIEGIEQPYDGLFLQLDLVSAEEQ